MTLEEAKQRIRDLERELADARRPLRLVYDAVPRPGESSTCTDDLSGDVIIDYDPAGRPRFRTGRRALLECDNSEVLGDMLVTVDFAE